MTLSPSSLPSLSMIATATAHPVRHYQSQEIRHQRGDLPTPAARAFPS